jgi:hypothetical protein
MNSLDQGEFKSLTDNTEVRGKEILARYCFSNILEIDLIVRRNVDRFAVTND